MSESDERIKAALEAVARYGVTDEAEYQQWVLDQVVRALTGGAYDAWVREYEQGGEYEWDTGIEP